MSVDVHDLAVIVLSTNEAHWLRPCLRTLFEHAGDIAVDVVVVDNGGTDETAEVVAREFPQARTVRCENHGFGHANNRGLETCNARYAMFLNCDTEIVDGTLSEVVRRLDSLPHVGVAGVLERSPDGSIIPTILRFPSPLRAAAEALGLGRLPLGSRLIEANGDPSAYQRETRCDWTIGASLVIRQEALRAAGQFDERFFGYCEDADLCRRARDAGFEVVYLPHLHVLHHVHSGKELSPRLVAQLALSRRLYALKHFSLLNRRLYLGAVALRYVLRMPFGPPRLGGVVDRWRMLLRLIGLLAGRGQPPFEPVAPTATRPRKQGEGAARSSRAGP